jgi:transcription elongation factor Elf1
MKNMRPYMKPSTKPSAKIPTCKRCNREMVSGQKAFQNTISISHDDLCRPGESDEGATMSYSGPARLVSVWKCPICGHSITA